MKGAELIKMGFKKFPDSNRYYYTFNVDAGILVKLYGNGEIDVFISVDFDIHLPHIKNDLRLKELIYCLDNKIV